MKEIHVNSYGRPVIGLLAQGDLSADAFCTVGGAGRLPVSYDDARKLNTQVVIDDINSPI